MSQAEAELAERRNLDSMDASAMRTAYQQQQRVHASELKTLREQLLQQQASLQLRKGQAEQATVSDQDSLTQSDTAASPQQRRSALTLVYAYYVYMFCTQMYNACWPYSARITAIVCIHMIIVCEPLNSVSSSSTSNIIGIDTTHNCLHICTANMPCTSMSSTAVHCSSA